MLLTVEVDISDDKLLVPSMSHIKQWIVCALQSQTRNLAAKESAEISIKVVNDAEMTQLNQDYRDKVGPTNVLSFPSDLPEVVTVPLLGDIVISADTVEREALAQAKPVEAHWAHLFVHGTLHLLGYDHIDDKEAEEMEHLESRILQSLGYLDPYILSTAQQPPPLQPPSSSK